MKWTAFQKAIRTTNCNYGSFVPDTLFWKLYFRKLLDKCIKGQLGNSKNADGRVGHKNQGWGEEGKDRRKKGREGEKL